MSKKHPTPWRLDADDPFADTPITDARGEAVLVRDNGVYPPDLDTCREIVEAVNERDRLRDELTRKAKNYEYDIAFHTRTEAGLRDIVRRLADSLQGIMDAADGKGEGALDESLLREARAAIGEYML